MHTFLPQHQMILQPLQISEYALNQKSSEELNTRMAEICLATMKGESHTGMIQERYTIQRILHSRSQRMEQI